MLLVAGSRETRRTHACRAFLLRAGEMIAARIAIRIADALWLKLRLRDARRSDEQCQSDHMVVSQCDYPWIETAIAAAWTLVPCWFCASAVKRTGELLSCFASSGPSVMTRSLVVVRSLMKRFDDALA